MRRVALQEADQVYFLHIPKTGGTSLLSTLYEYFPGEERVHYHLHNLLTPPERLPTQRFIAGHTLYTIHNFLNREPYYVTILRDPVARVISHFRHIQRVNDHPYHAKFRDATLLDFLHTREGKIVSRNFQTASLDIDVDPRVAIKNFTPAELRELGGGYALMAVHDQSREEELLDRVKGRLRNFAFVGILERFEESLDLLAYTFHWERFADAARTNVDPNPPADISPEAYDLIAERTQLDQQVYDLALDLLETRQREMMLDLLKTEHRYQSPEASDDRPALTASVESVPPLSAPYLKKRAGWADGWVGPHWTLSTALLPPHMKQVKISGKVPLKFMKRPFKLSVYVAGKCVQELEVQWRSRFSITIPLTDAPLDIMADQYFIPAQVAQNDDHRPLSWQIVAITMMP